MFAHCVCANFGLNAHTLCATFSRDQPEILTSADQVQSLINEYMARSIHATDQSNIFKEMDDDDLIAFIYHILSQHCQDDCVNVVVIVLTNIYQHRRLHDCNRLLQVALT